MSESWSETDIEAEQGWDAAPVVPVEAPADPLTEYVRALLEERPDDLVAMANQAGVMAFRSWPSKRVADALAERIAEPGVAASFTAGLDFGPRAALTLFALTESRPWPLEGLAHALACLGAPVFESLAALSGVGLVSTRGLAGWLAVAMTLSPGERAVWLEAGHLRAVTVHPHPAAAAAVKPAVPDGSAVPRALGIRQEREADGLEGALRLAVVWQRVAEAPLRQTQNGAFYKKDRERLEDDPAVAGPIADALEPLPDMAALWVALARGVGLLESEPGSERVAAAPSDYWSENAYHLPQMIAGRWLALWNWHEQGGMQQEGVDVALALPFARAPVLLWLASVGPDDWVATQDLSAFLRGLHPQWDRPTFQGPPSLRGGPDRGQKGRPEKATGAPKVENAEALEAMLLGAAYQLGLVRVAEEVPTGRRVVKLSALGRYLLALGPPPPSRPPFEHFLFVQPSFEVIAYRQGLSPSVIGRFSRFTRWTQVGAAIALTLTAESVYRGLEGGLTPRAMIDELQKHSPRPLPTGVAEAIRTWASRRDRVTYHAAATLVEFVTPEDLEAALEGWPEAPDRPSPVRVTDRLLLVEDDRAIPFQRFRLTGARNYRNPPETCVEVGADGVTLTLDPARSDLLVDAELARFAVEGPPITVNVSGYNGQPGAPQARRRFSVTSESLARATELGLAPNVLSLWFHRRTGGPTPPAVRLIQAAGSPDAPPLTASRRLVLRAPSADLLDGLAQHPETRDYLGERLGDDAVLVSEALFPGLRQALDRLGLRLDLGPDAG